MQISPLDRKIIIATQNGIAISEHPYKEIALELNIAESELLNRMQLMKETGVIRRVALVPNHYKLGFTANGMSVWKIHADKIDTVGNAFGQLPYVSHCYERATHDGYWEYNIFAMVHGRKQQDVEVLIETMYDLIKPYCESYDVLYSEKILKKSGLRLQSKD